MEGTKEHVLVIWAMASDNRPHMCRESEKEGNRHYIRNEEGFIRPGTSTAVSARQDPIRRQEGVRLRYIKMLFLPYAFYLKSKTEIIP